MKRNILMLFSLFLLAACMNPNDRLFRGSWHTLLEAHLNPSASSVFIYADNHRLDYNLLIMREQVPAQYREAFISSWIDKERGYRQGQCDIQQASVQDVVYYTCDAIKRLPNGARFVVYVVGVQGDMGYAKTYLSLRELSQSEQEEIALALNQFSLD